MTLEDRLMDIDFSKFSKVQDTLLQKINNRRRLERELMDEDELDEVAAAGINGGVNKPVKHTDLNKN